MRADKLYRPGIFDGGKYEGRGVNLTMIGSQNIRRRGAGNG